MLSLFDIKIEEVHVLKKAKPKAQVVIHEPKKMPIKSTAPIQKKELMARLMNLSSELEPYKEQTLEEIAQYSKSESDWVRAMRIQVEQLKITLKEEK